MYRKLAIPFVALATAAWGAPVWAASGCEDVWFTRNLIMDRAGFCFTSPLGQSLFDNSDCTGQQVQLDPAATVLVQKIQALESRHKCRVDTNRRMLDIKDIAFRRVLRDLPIYQDGEWGCLGWKGVQAPLYDGYSEPFHAIGQVLPGDYVSFGFDGPGLGWAYVTIHAPVWGAFKSAGWLYWPGEIPCIEEAG